MHAVLLENLQVLLEAKNDFNQDRWTATWQAVIGAYDVEATDRISVHISQPPRGTLVVSSLDRSVPHLLQSCDKDQSSEVMELITLLWNTFKLTDLFSTENH